jgi:hypothetical protein
MDWLLTLQNAGLPAISAYVNPEGKVEATFSRGLTPTEWLLFLQLTDTPRYDSEIDKASLKAEYQATITQLQNIEAATNPTNAQVIAAVKFLAKTLRLLLKLLARMV